MSINTVEIRAFSGPATVELAGVGVPEIVEVRQGPPGPNTVTSATTSNGTADLSVADITSGFYRFPTQTSADNFDIAPVIIVPDFSGQTTTANIEAIYTLPLYPLSDGVAYLATTTNADGTIAIDSNTETTFDATTVLISDGTNVSSLAYTEDNTPTSIAFRDSGGNCSFNNVNAAGILSSLTCDIYEATNTFYNRITSVATANRTNTLPDASGTIALTTSNVSTATALQTSRNIFGIAFNGTANVSGDATNAGHFASIPTGGQAGHFITLNGTAPTVIAGRSAWWSDASGNPSFRNGTGNAVTLVRSSDLGTGVATALAVNVGSTGAFVVNGGALGTPSSGTLTSCTGLPISTGVSGLAANVATFLATPSSANLRAALTDETGTGAAVFADSPTFTGTPLIGTKTILSENGFQRAFLSSDYTIATTSITNKIPSFSISVVSGKTYKLEIMLKVTGVAGSTHNVNLIGSFNLAAAESSMLYRRAGFETENFVSAATPYQGFALFNTTGTSSQICFLDGIIKPSTSGTLEVYLNSGSATNSVTMLKGAYIEATLLD